MPAEPSCVVQIPGLGAVDVAHVVLDFTGTLSKDGELLPGVAWRMVELARVVRVTVMTADTFNKAKQALAGLPVDVRIISIGADKEAYVNQLGARQVVAIGNGRNDVPMVNAAGLGIAVIGPEGAAAELIRAADVVVSDINDALDLITNPLRLKATLRE